MRAARVLALAAAVAAAAACKKESTPKPPPVPKPGRPTLSAARVADGERALAQDCGICHSQDLILSQRLTQPQWEKELKKMAGWGAPLPPEDAAPLLDLLLARAGSDAAEAEPARMTVAAAQAELAPDGAALTGDRTRGGASYRAACLSCHGVGGAGGSGPALTGRPILDRAGDFLATVKSGRQRMPAFAGFDAADVLVYLRTL